METETARPVSRTRTRLAYGIAALGIVGLLGAISLGLAYGRTKLVGIVVFGFIAMMLGVLVSRLGNFATPGRQVWAYGLASGAMLASAAALIAPKAITQHPEYGGFAIALGYLIGYGGHELGHLVTHYELPVNAATSELTLHALAAGSIMGVAYGALPSLTALFGYGIVAHKFPAGFTGTEAVKQANLPVSVMFLPAAAVAISAIPLSILTPTLSPIVKAIFFGVSTGVFAHVGIDMLPECSHVGSHADATGHGAVQCSTEADRLRQYAVLSTFLGAGAIFVFWQFLSMG
ncbi:ZIP family metal transporter [Halanaeroarchaeum sp. HSR-CO]|uniref:ZIP family metal transporter n=1 Tax=Halanaeroarchaeum sp. HSR-CO TaxID=2866382 RepID=UPI00217CE606|nr:ZIP family metal transporter [Halanaeroarchaeum sp. HSR-CO]